MRVLDGSIVMGYIMVQETGRPDVEQESEGERMIIANQIPDKTELTVSKVNEEHVYVEFTIKAIAKAGEIQSLYSIIDSSFIELNEAEEDDSEEDEE